MSVSNAQLLSSVEFRDALQVALRSADRSVVVFSAYVTVGAVEWLSKQAKTHDLTVVARWDPNDLSGGASDFQSYWRAKELGIKFGILPNLHGKVFCVDERLFLGSANATQRGLALTPNHNLEFGVGISEDKIAADKLLSYLDSVFWLNDEIVSRMQNEIKKLNFSAQKTKWPRSITDILFRPVEFLWVHEVPTRAPDEIEDDGDREINEFLGIDTAASFDDLRTDFRNSRSFLWLENLLRHNGSMSFGAITAALHNALLNDPKPYRREVKQLVKNLIEWARCFPEYFEISKPRHSTVLRWIQENDLH